MRKNGAGFAGQVEINAEAGAGIDRTLHGCTPAMTIGPGDTSAVGIDQGSGAALELLPGNSTWFVIERWVVNPAAPGGNARGLGVVELGAVARLAAASPAQQALERHLRAELDAEPRAELA